MLDKEELLSSLYNECSENLTIFIKSQIYSKSHSDAEDCVHDVFLIAVKKAETLDIKIHPNIKGWLFKIAKHVVNKFNTYYMKSTLNVVYAEVDINSLISDDKDFTNRLIEDIIYDEIDKKKFIDDITKTLLKNEKELFLMKLKGVSNKDIAVVFNISENAVKSRYKRILKKLRKNYKNATPL